MQNCTEIDSHLNSVKKRKNGEVVENSVENNIESVIGKRVESRDGSKEHVKLGAPVNKVEAHDPESKDIIVKPKLPKITLPKFSGEVVKFRGFWDRYKSAVHNNQSLSAVDKFNYLHTLLEGSAAWSLQGLALTELITRQRLNC